MSLINEALKRAKDAQQQAPPPPPSQLQFRPVEPSQHPRQGLGLFISMALAVGVLVALFFAWQRLPGRTTTGVQEVRALTPPPTPSAAAPQPTAPPLAAVAVAAQSTPAPQPASQPSVVIGTMGLPSPTTTPTPENVQVAKEPESAPTNSAVIAEPPAPKLPPLKLQAIVFNPKRPSVVINGRTLFVGEKLGEARVVAIDQESATLVAAGKTNILTMSE